MWSPPRGRRSNRSRARQSCRALPATPERAGDPFPETRNEDPSPRCRSRGHRPCLLPRKRPERTFAMPGKGFRFPDPIDGVSPAVVPTQSSFWPFSFRIAVTEAIGVCPQGALRDGEQIAGKLQDIETGVGSDPEKFIVEYREAGDVVAAEQRPLGRICPDDDHFSGLRLELHQAVRRSADPERALGLAREATAVSCSLLSPFFTWDQAGSGSSRIRRSGTNRGPSPSRRSRRDPGDAPDLVRLQSARGRLRKVVKRIRLGSCASAPL